MSDSLTVFGTDYTGVTGIKAKGTGNGTLTYIRPSGTKSISANGSGIDVTEYASVDVAVPGVTPTGNINITQSGVTDVTNYATATVADASQYVSFDSGEFYTDENVRRFRQRAFADVDTSEGDSPGWVGEGKQYGEYATYQAVPANTTVTPTTSAQTVGGAYYMMEGPVTVAAMPTGTAGTPTATKGSVSNHSVSVTPSVTNTTGYITGSTKTGTAVTVSASELVSGTYTVDSSGTKDVTNYAAATVPMADFGPSVGGSFIYSSGGNLVWRESGGGYAESAGWVNEGGVNDYLDYNAIPQNITITPTTSAQIIGGARYMMQGPVTVAAMPSGTAGTPSATKGSVSNHSISITPSVTNQTGYITGGTQTGTAVTVSASELVSGSQTITTNDTYDVTNLASVVVDVQGGGSSSMLVDTAEGIGASSSISFSGLKGEPIVFDVIIDENITPSAQQRAAAISFDGTTIHGQTITNTSNAQVTYNNTAFTKSYSNGTLTITSNGASFGSSTYYLTYAYGGSAGDIDTKDVQVGSGATSITFSGLEDEPIYWSCIFKSNFGTSSGYQRVIFAEYGGGSDIYGLAMDSSSHVYSYWTASYSNGSLTITSQGTNAGGYFHQPGYYQLTYAIGGEAGSEEIDVQPLSVTQNGTYTAPDGVAYSPVTVAVSGGGGVSVGKTTWSNSSTSTVSHQFTGLSGTPKAAFLRCTAQLTRSSSNTYYYIADIVWDGTNAYGNYHLRSNGSYNNVASDAQSGFNVSVSGTSITFSSDATSRSSAPGSFYNGQYELTYIY